MAQTAYEIYMNQKAENDPEFQAKIDAGYRLNSSGIWEKGWAKTPYTNYGYEAPVDPSRTMNYGGYYDANQGGYMQYDPKTGYYSFVGTSVGPGCGGEYCPSTGTPNYGGTGTGLMSPSTPTTNQYDPLGLSQPNAQTSAYNAPGTTGNAVISGGGWNNGDLALDYKYAFEHYPTGVALPWANGTITFSPDKAYAIYQPTTGPAIRMDASANVMDVANLHPDIYRLWSGLYPDWFKPSGSTTGNTTATSFSPGSVIPNIAEWGAEDVSKHALQVGTTLLKDRLNNIGELMQYPAFVGSQSTAPPGYYNYYDYTAPEAMKDVAAPEYQGLMGGDYDRLEQALVQPGKIAAGQAYQTGLRDLTNVMGGRGLYGSSIMANAANEGINREYMNALATNAANATAQRYGLQASDLANLNQFAAQNYQTATSNAYDQWRAGLANSESANTYGQSKAAWDRDVDTNYRNYLNNAALEKYNYDLVKQAYEQQQYENLFAQAMALANQAAPLSTANQNYQLMLAQLSAQQQAAKESSMSGLLSALAGAGGLMGASYLAKD